jgi:hypothetical protein
VVTETHIDGNALIDAKRESKKCFLKLVQKYRRAGASDRQILDAMVASRAVIDSIGSLREIPASRRPRR